MASQPVQHQEKTNNDNDVVIMKIMVMVIMVIAGSGSKSLGMRLDKSQPVYLGVWTVGDAINIPLMMS